MSRGNGPSVLARFVDESVLDMLPQFDKAPTLKALVAELIRLSEAITAQAARNQALEDSDRRLAAAADSSGPEQYAKLLALANQARARRMRPQPPQRASVMVEIDLGDAARPVAAVAAASHAGYLKRKATGRCVRCKDLQAIEGETRCVDCKHKEQESRKRRERKERAAARQAATAVGTNGVSTHPH